MPLGLLHVGELRLDGGEGVRDAGADRVERRHDGDRDESGEQAVFDRGRAVLVTQETLERRHDSSPVFFRKFEATSSLMRGNLGRMREANPDNFALRANTS